MTSTVDHRQGQERSELLIGRRRIWLPSLGLRVSERRFLLIVVDILLLNLALVISLVLRTELLPDIQAALWNIKWFVTLLFLWAIVAIIFNVYDLARASSTTYSLWAIASATGFTSLIYISIPWLTPPIENRSQAYIFVGLSVILLATWRFLYANIFIQPAFQRRSLVVGAGNSAKALVHALKDDGLSENGNPYRGTGHQIVGFIDDNAYQRQEQFFGIPVLGGSKDLVSLVIKQDIDEIVVAITETEKMRPELFEAILICREIGLPVVSMTTIYERLTGRVAYEHASLNVEVATGQTDSPFLRFYEVLKRIVDYAGAILGLIIVLLSAPIIALVNRITSPGPIFFRQRRVGHGGKIINIIKFRSMVPGAEDESGVTWAEENDSRVTTAGRWMRLTHLDELPQVINVLLGEMSLVGPRPERPEFVEEFSRLISFYRARHSVRPGITGWAQIHQDYGDSIDRAKEKLEFDLYYLKHAGPMLDTIIILRTITKVLGFRGR